MLIIVLIYAYYVLDIISQVFLTKSVTFLANCNKGISPEVLRARSMGSFALAPCTSIKGVELVLTLMLC